MFKGDSCVIITARNEKEKEKTIFTSLWQNSLTVFVTY